jgi:RimJ/RimL family protein N-acetyltransferase
MAYWVRSSQIGRGLATAAVKLLAGFGFDELGLNRLEIVVAKGNFPSQRVAEKAGALREGELRRRIQVRDRIFDVVMFSLIPTDMKESAGR